jgi:integrase
MSGDGTYIFRGTSAQLRWRANGKTCTETMRGTDGKRPTVGAIKARLRELQTLVDQNKHPNDPEKLLFADWCRRWLEQRTPDMAPRSREQHESSIRVHIAPALGHFRLAKLKRADVMDFRAQLAAKELARNTRRQLQTLVSVILAAAVEAEIIAVNPAAGIKNRFEEETVERTILKPAECTKLLDYAKPTPLYPAILLALAGGLRRGEIVGLKWTNCDLDQGGLKIAENVTVVGGERYTRKPKNKKARIVTIPPSVVAELRRVKREQAELLLRFGIRQTGDTAVCERPELVNTPNGLGLQFRRLIRKSGLPICRFHDLRHAHATNMLDLGVPVTVVAKRIGHTDGGRLLLSTYAHSDEDQQRKAADKLEALFSAG